MAETTTPTLHASGVLNNFVAQNVGDDGANKNISEYIRDLVRNDKALADDEAFQRLKAELTYAFSASEASYKPMSAADVIDRNCR